jgi:hypothetical protein
MNNQLATVFLQPNTATGTQEATNHPATNAVLFPKPWRTWKSTTTADGWTLTLDFGAAVAPPGFFLNNGNFAVLKAAVSPNGTTWSELYSGGGVSFGVDDRVQPRRKQWYPASGWLLPWNHRYFRLQAFTCDAGATAFELGAIAVPQALTTMTRNFGPPEWTPREPLTRLPYAGGGSEGNVEGRTLMAFDLVYGPNFKDAIGQLHALRAIGQDLPFLYIDNRGDPTHSYILKRVAEVKFSEQYAALQVAPWTLEECV